MGAIELLRLEEIQSTHEHSPMAREAKIPLYLHRYNLPELIVYELHSHALVGIVLGSCEVWGTIQ